VPFTLSVSACKYSLITDNFASQATFDKDKGDLSLITRDRVTTCPDGHITLELYNEQTGSLIP